MKITFEGSIDEIVDSMQKIFPLGSIQTEPKVTADKVYIDDYGNSIMLCCNKVCKNKKEKCSHE